MRKILALLLAASPVAACGERESTPSPEAVEARRVAGRNACIATQLVQQTTDELQTLEQLGAPGLVGFTRALNQHAQLREAAYAQQDSALRHSPTPADSTRHAAAAARFQIRTPEAGTVEHNVMLDYERKFAAIVQDTDHPCNWQTELEEAER